MNWLYLVLGTLLVVVIMFNIYHSASDESIAMKKPKKYTGIVERIGVSSAGDCLHILFQGENHIWSMRCSSMHMALTICGDVVEFTKADNKESCATFSNKTLEKRLDLSNQQAVTA